MREPQMSLRRMTQLLLTSLSTPLFLTLVAPSAIAQAGINLRLMPLGDSITAGYESSTYTGPYQ